MLSPAEDTRLWTPRRRGAARVHKPTRDEVLEAMGLGVGLGVGLQGGASDFSPRDLFQGANAAWFRADRLVTGSPNITAIGDLSGNGNDLTVNVNSPTLVTDAGRPTIRLDGTSAQQLRRTGPTSGAFAYTLALVAKIDTTTVATNRLFGVHRARGCAIGSTTSTMLCAHAGSVNVLGGAHDTANYKVYIAYGGNASPFTPTLMINGVVQTNSPAGNQSYLNTTSAGDFISIGYDAVSCKGWLWEVLWIDRQVSAAQALQLNTHLIAQYSIT